MRLGVGFGRITQAEYQANLNGLNMFFGAMLGIVMAGSERMNAWMFAYVLMMVAGTVVCILYVTASKHRLAYGALALGLSLFMPIAIDEVLAGRGILPDKVQPTLIVWTLMMLGIEFYPRQRVEAAITGS